MRVERADQAEIADRRAVAEQEWVKREMPVEIGEQSLVALFDRWDRYLVDTENRHEAAKLLADHLSRRDLLITRRVGHHVPTEFFENPFLVVVPAVMHRRDDKPFIAETFEQERGEALARRFGID